METSTAANTEALRLDHELTVSRAETLKNDLVKRITTSPTLSLDLSHVRQADTIGVQLILSAARAAKQAGGQLKLVNLSAPFTTACAAAGVELTEFETLQSIQS